MKKRSFLFVGALVMALAITGCNKKKNSSPQSVISSQTPITSVEPAPSSAVTPSSAKPSSQVAPSSKPVSSNPAPSSNPVTSNPQPSSAPQPSSTPAPSSVPTPSSQPGSSVIPETTKYYALYDGQEFALSVVEYNAQGQTGEYKANLGNIEKGKTISILDSNKQALSENFNAEDGDNNVISQEGAYVIHNDAQNAFVLVKEWESGWTNFYVSGYVADPVVAPVYKVVGTMNEWKYENSTITFVDATIPAEVENNQYVTQLKAEFSVDKDDEFKVQDQLDHYLGAEILENNADFAKLDGGNIKALAKGEVDLYLKTFADGSLGLAIYFEKEVIVPVYKVVGTMNEWNYENSAITFVDATVAEEVEKGWYSSQLKASFKVAADDEFKVLNQLGVYLGAELLEDNANFQKLEGGNIKAKSAGDVDLYLKTLSNGGLGLSITFTGETPVAPEYDYYVEYDGNKIAATKIVDATLAEHQLAEYKVSLGDVEIDKRIALLDGNGLALTENYGADPAEDNNVKGEAGNYLIKSDAKDAYVLIRVWDTPWVNFFVSGYELPPVVQPVYKVVGTMNEWNYANSTITFADVTLAEEVEKGWYVSQLRATFDVTANTEFKVLDQLGNYFGGEILENNDDFNKLEDGNIQAKYNGEVNLYFKTFSDGSRGLSIVFNREVVVHVFKVVGTMTSWNYADSTIEFEDATDPEEVANNLYRTQLKAEFSVNKDDEFKLLDQLGNYVGGEYLEANANFNVLEGGNIQAKYNGDVDLYLKQFVDGTLGISIVFTKEAVAPTYVYYVQYGENVIGATLDTEAVLAENQTAQYKVTLDHVAKDTVIAILDGEQVALSSSFNALPGDNNVVESEGSYKIHNDADDVTILIKVWDTPWVNFYVSGYVADPVVNPVYKVVGTMNEWNYANSTITFADATVAEEVEKEWYVSQLKATFDVAANAEFKVLDQSGNYFGGEILESNANFQVLDGGNIKALTAGTVELYFKTFANGNHGLAIVFTGEQITPQEVTVTLTVTKDVGESNSIYLVGEFCNWNASNEHAIRFVRGENNVWTAEIIVTTGTHYECKLVVANTENPNAMSWENGANRDLVFMAAGTYELTWQN